MIEKHVDMKNSPSFYYTTIILLMIILQSLQAQNAVVASGGSFYGESGAVSYSLGQISYQTVVANDGKMILEGVHQPYEVFEMTLDIKSSVYVNIKLYVYPNPTATDVTLKIDDDNFYTRWPKGLNLEILDINGRLIKRDKIFNKTNIISLKNLEEATYFFNILTEESIIVKSFKIVKGL